MPNPYKPSPPHRQKNSQLHVLIVKSSPAAADRLVQSLAEAGYASQHTIVHSLGDMATALAENSFGLILTDWRLPDSNGSGPYDVYQQANSVAPLIVCSDEPNDQEAREALRSDVYDYVTSDRLHLIGPLVERALRDSEVRHQAKSTRQELDKIYGELERRIEERTSAIEALNERLREEVHERRRTEQQLHLAIAGSEGTIWTISFDESDPWHVPEHVVIPARQKQMLGFANDEFPNSFSAWESRIHPQDLPTVRKEIQNLFDGVIDFSSIEYRIRHRDGTYRWLQLRGSLLRDQAGRPVEWNRIVWDITSRKTVEQSILEQKDQLLLAIEGSAGMIWSIEADPTDPQGWSDAFHIDPRMKQFLGFAPEEFPSSRRAWDIRIPEDYRRHAQQAMAAHAIGDEERFTVEYPIQHRDGHYVWASMRGWLIRDDQGMPVRMIGMMWDITDRKQYEQQLAESEARFRMLVEASPDGIAIHQNERIQFVNKAFVELMGAESPSQLIGLPIWQLIRPDFHAGVKERMATVTVGEALPPLEEVWTTLDGKELSVEVTGSSLTWRGRPAYQAILRDISYRLSAERAIRESQQKLERAAAMTGLGHWESNPGGQEIWISPEMCEILGIGPCETISRDVYMKAIHPDDRAMVERTILAALRDGHPYEVEFRLVRPDGDVRVVHARGEVSPQEADSPGRSFGAMQDVTKQRLQERALRESEERLGLAIEGTGLATWDVDLTTGDTVWSEGFYRMLGYGSAMTLPSYEKWVKALHPDDSERVLQTVQDAKDNRNTYTTEYRIIQYGTGDIRWQQATGRFFYDHTNRATRFLGVVLDTTERKRAEEALAHSEARLRATLHSIPDEVWIVDAEGKPVLISDAVTENLGVEPREWGDIWAAIDRLEIFYPDGTPRPTDQAALVRSLQGEVVTGLLESVRNVATGELRWREVASAPTRDAAGRITGAVLVARDVTERRNVEEALRQNGERLRAMFDSAGVGIVEVDTYADRIIAANQRLSEILGRPVEDMIGLTIHDLTHPDDRAESDELNDELHLGRKAQISYEKRYLRGDGSPVWVHVTVSAVRDGQGRWVRSIATIEDISERRLAEEALRRSRSLMAEAERLARIGAWEWNLVADQWSFSEEWLSIHGVDAQTLSPDELLAIAHPDDRPAIQQAFEDVRTGRKAYDIEHRIIRQGTGEVRFVRAAGRYVCDASGHLVRVYGFAQDITERKKAEETLRRNDERLRVAVEAANLGTWDLDLVNDTAVRSLRHDQIWGYLETQQEWGLEKAMRYVVPDDRPSIEEAYARGMKTGVLSHENRIIWPDGSLHWIEAYGRFYYDDAGRPIRVTGVVADITDRKRAEEALRDSEEKFRAVFEQAAIGMGRVQFESAGWIDVNDALCEMLGRTREEMLSTPWPEMTHPEDIDLDLFHFKQMAQGELENYVVEKRFIHKDGHHVWARLTLSLARNAQGQPSYEIAIIEDITARKRAEEALRESEDRFTIAFRSSPDALVISSVENGLIIDVNETWVRRWGYSRQESLGRRSIDLGIFENPGDRDRVLEVMRQEGEVRDFPIEIRTRTGELRCAELSGSPLRLENRELMLTIIRDVTERKRTEVELQRAKESYRLLVENQTDMLALMSRDGRRLYVNPIFLQAVGKSEDEIMNSGYALEIHPDDVPRVAAEWQKTFEPPHYQSDIEARTMTVRGWRWHSWRNRAIFDEHGEPTRAISVGRDVTELKETEAALQQSEQRFRSIFASNVAALAIWNTAGQLLDANDKFLEILGYTRKQFDMGEVRWDEATPPELRQRDYEAVKELLAGREIQPYEKAFVRPDGTRVPVLIGGSMLPGTDDLGVAFAVDITERKQAEEQLAASTERYRRLVDSSPHGIFVHVGGQITYANPAAVEHLGYSDAGELIGRRWQDIVAPEDRDHTDRLLALYTGEATSVASIDLRLQRVDGSILEAEVAASSFELDGKLAIQEIVHDISDLRRLTAALTDAQERVRMTVSASNVSLWQVDQSLRYIWVYNPQTHATAETVIGKSDRDILPYGDDAERMSALKRRCMETGQSLRQELMLHKPDGSPMWFELSLEPWRDETGRVVGVNGASINISERKKAAEELVLAHDKLRRFVDANIVGIVLASSDGMLHEGNDYFLNLVGYTREELRDGQLKWSEITPEEYLPADQHALDELKATGVCTPYEKEFIHRDGSRVPVLIADALLPGPDHQIVGFVLDITDRKQFERELQEAHAELERRVFERTGELIEANKLLFREVEERSQAEQKLRHATEQLQQEREVLERKNIALKEILGQIDSEKAALKSQLSTNVEQVIMPTLRRLKEAPKHTAERLLDVLERDLQTITAPFVDTLKTGLDKLSPRELEVCRLIRNGLSTKEMAEILNLSPMTVQKHREIIRKKLGLTGGDTNLRSFLQSLTDTGSDIG